MLFKNVLLGKADKPDQGPGCNNNHPYFPDHGGRLELHHLQCHGQPDNPDQQAEGSAYRMYQRIVPDIRCTGQTLLNMAQYSLLHHIHQQGDKYDGKDIHDPELFPIELL